MIHLLAPVPAVHIPSARQTLIAQGVVAFGSNAFEVLNPLQGKEVTVWIAASATDAPPSGVPAVEIGRVVMRARLRGIVAANRRGRHPNDALRPATTLNDSEFHYGLFWEVEAAQDLHPGIPVVGLRTAKGVRLEAMPLGPILIRDPELSQ